MGDPSSTLTKALSGVEPNYLQLAQMSSPCCPPSLPRHNIIAVSATDSQGIELHEYMDGARQSQ